MDLLAPIGVALAQRLRNGIGKRSSALQRAHLTDRRIQSLQSAQLELHCRLAIIFVRQVQTMSNVRVVNPVHQGEEHHAKGEGDQLVTGGQRRRKAQCGGQ